MSRQCLAAKMGQAPSAIKIANRGKEGPYHQANSGPGQEGTIQNIRQISNNVK